MKRAIRLLTISLFVAAGFAFAVPATGEERTSSPAYAELAELVARTHRKSLAAREAELRSTVARGSWLPGGWGDTNGALAALFLDQKTDESNARLLKRASAFVAEQTGAEQPSFEPGETRDAFPWGYFGLTDYVRILCMFRQGSPHYPGRLSARTEAAMKEALWLWVKGRSRVDEASLDDLLVTQGTENHDLTLRPSYYLIASVLKEDPTYNSRLYDDGHTAAAHFAAYNAYFRAWPRQRAMSGLWIEVGSDTYQKYSWPALFNLHELSPDPTVRRGFGMLLDLALIEEAQISVRGRRGGGRSRAHYGQNRFEYYKNLLYVPEGAPAGASHSKVIATSSYQPPDAAIALRYIEFPTEGPFLITNRVLGEIEREHRFLADSSLVNYAYRTPLYLIGSTLQNPSLSIVDPATGQPVLKYGGISRQNRWCGILLDDPRTRPPLIPATSRRAENEMCAIYPEIEKTRGGRPQHPFWSVQHKNVLLLQRIVSTRGGMGSYGTGRISVRFHGQSLQRTEAQGWIFASTGSAFVAVRFLDGGYTWDDTGELASPTSRDPAQSARILFHAGDVNAHGSFQQFRQTVLSGELTVDADRVAYRSDLDGARIEFFQYHPERHREFQMPRIDGVPIDLDPRWTYRSPYLKCRAGEDQITVSVGPIQEIYDFGRGKIRKGSLLGTLPAGVPDYITAP